MSSLRYLLQVVYTCTCIYLYYVCLQGILIRAHSQEMSDSVTWILKPYNKLNVRAHALGSKQVQRILASITCTCTIAPVEITTY